jgi:hypothetical protein
METPYSLAVLNHPFLLKYQNATMVISPIPKMTKKIAHFEWRPGRWVKFIP